MNKAVEKINLINYISWIELFTEVESSFYDDSYLCRDGDNKKMEHGNAAKLECFYRELDKILKQENIRPIVDNYQTYYSINYHGNNYEIGFMEGAEVVYFCRRVTPKDKMPVDFLTVEKRLIKTNN